MKIFAVAFFALVVSSCSAAQSQQPVYYFDVTSLINVNQTNVPKKWDTAHVLAAIQGIANREQPTLFIRFIKDNDDFWWAQLRKKDEWLHGKTVKKFHSLKELIYHFRDQFKGVVVYDGKVPATCNLASTIAGVENRLPLRYDKSKDSIYSLVMNMNFYKDVKMLINSDGSSMFTGKGLIPGTMKTSTGSAKNDAYIWAKINYLDKGLCSKNYMAYYIDSYWLNDPGDFAQNCLFNHDFFISRKAFFFDLDPWEDEAPVDDENQTPGTDSKTLKMLLKSFNKIAENKIFTISGFVPWTRKYTNFKNAGGKHKPVSTEWHYAKIISEYNGVMDADAPGLGGMINASFYQHYPLKKKYFQNKKPTIDDLKKQGFILTNGSVKKLAYVLIYMGDYDSAAWMHRVIPDLWENKDHTNIVCTWAFNPNLCERVPHVFDFVRRQKMSNDWFMSGDSGAGYLNPSMLCKENRDNGLPDALDEWVKWNKKYFEKFDLDVTGFIIDGAAPPPNKHVLDAYSEFSKVGIVGQKLSAKFGIHKNMPFIKMAADLPSDASQAGELVAGMVGIRPTFLAVRSVLKNPTWHLEMMKTARESSDNRIVFVDPYTFFTLLKIHIQNPKNTKTKSNKYVVWSVNNDDELTPISFPDGAFQRKEFKDEKVIYQTADNIQYIYFQLAESFAKKFARGNRDAEVQITLFDNKKGKIGIHYDGLQDGESKPYIDLENYKLLKGNKKWRTITFKLKTPLFLHRQNASSDFRLINFNTDFIIKKVKVISK